MSDLQRERAPFSQAVWNEIDEEAKRVLALHLAGRRLVDFKGPLGWNASAIDLGRTRTIDEQPALGVKARLRQSQPLVELHAPFTVSREEMEAIERGAKDADLEPVITAAKAIAHAEDRAIFHGYPEALILGIAQASAERVQTLSADFQRYPDTVAAALRLLRDDGIEGPYAIALGPRCYAGLTTTTTTAGYPILKHVRQLIDGPIVWAPAVNGAVVMSLRGGDFELAVGRDLSIGYWDHDARDIHLYLVESLTFQVFTPEAAVPLVYADKG